MPAVSMRLWSEERKLGTLELLMTMPVRDRDAVMGKFFASWALLGMTLLLTLPLAAVVFSLGAPDPGPIWGGYLGAFLMGGAYLAIGQFASSLSENQIVAFIMGVVITFLLYIIGNDMILFACPRFLVGFFGLQPAP